MGYLMVNLPSGHALLGAKFGLLLLSLLGGDKGLRSRERPSTSSSTFDDGAWRTFFSDTNPAFFSFSRSSNGL